MLGLDRPIYYGIGDMDYNDRAISKKLKSVSNIIPEFFLMRLRSKEDIGTRLMMIFDIRLY
jgi:hypothetical protein